MKVRRALGPDGMDRPKSKHGVRDVPVPPEMVRDLRRHVAALPAVTAATENEWGHLAFPSTTGGPTDADNLRRRVLKPAAEEADVSWAGSTRSGTRLRRSTSSVARTSCVSRGCSGTTTVVHARRLQPHAR